MIFVYIMLQTCFSTFGTLSKTHYLNTTIHALTNPVSIQAFHVFHVSCLIHWILLCELETYDKPVDEPKKEIKAKRRSKRKAGNKRSAKMKKDEIKAARQIYSVFCPECQGTGITIEEGEELEKPPISLSEVCKQPAMFHSSL